MAPILNFSPGAQPHLQPHLLNRQEEQPSTSMPPANPTPTIILVPSTTVPSLTTSTSSTVIIPAASSDSPDRGAVIGGVLGGFLGFFVLCALLYKCCYDNRSALYALPSSPYRHHHRHRNHSSSSVSSSDSTSSRIRRRGGGGSDWSGLRRPSRAYTRRSRDYYGYNGRRRSSINKSDRYKRDSVGMRGMEYKNGLFGWPLAVIHKPVYVETRERERWSSGKRSSGGGAHKFTIDD